jgi:hypothetical protein
MHNSEVYIFPNLSDIGKSLGLTLGDRSHCLQNRCCVMGKYLKSGHKHFLIYCYCLLINCHTNQHYINRGVENIVW